MFTKLAISPPVLLLTLAVSGFAVWVSSRVTEPEQPPKSAPTPQASSATHEPLPIEVVLGLVHPGMPRQHVLQQLRTLDAPEDYASDVPNAKPGSRLAYRVQLDRPVPHLMFGMAPHEFVPGEYLFVLQFNMSRPGHPLVNLELQPQLHEISE